MLEQLPPVQNWSVFNSSTPIVQLLSTQHDLPAPVPHLLQLVRALLAWDPPLARFVDEDSCTALSSACCMRYPQLAILNELVSAFPEALMQPDNEFTQMPLHHLLQHAGEGLLTLELVKLLSADGAAAALSAVNIHGETPLHIFLSRAAPQLELDVFRFLCGAHPSAVTALDKYERSTLMRLAACSGSMDVATMLLTRAPSLSALTTSESDNALHFAAENMTAARLSLFLHLLKLHPEHAGIILPSKGTVLFALLRSLPSSDSGSAFETADPASVRRARLCCRFIRPSVWRRWAMKKSGPFILSRKWNSTALTRSVNYCFCCLQRIQSSNWQRVNRGRTRRCIILLRMRIAHRAASSC
jgi:ankyrin repeat protein